ncbi:MAG: DUF1302 domain-containing protein [Dechloromonas sp.]|nr:DUF1302 domain-containing protein [Dechloromonas sp.]
MHQHKCFKRSTLAAVVATLGMGGAGQAHAFKFDLDNGISGSVDSTISLGVQRRMQSPDKSMVGRENGGSASTTGRLGELVNGAGQGATSNPDFNYTNIDDGNLNYKKGDIVAAVLKGTHELALGERGNWAALGRVTWSTDFAAANTVRTPLDDEAKKAMTQNVSLLDLWVSKDFKVGDNSAKFKLGNQVINWGEDIFIFGGINTIHAFDLRKAHIPGTQVKEILIPAPMASLNMALGAGFSTEMYYQFAWNSFKLDPAGTYWSTADFIGKGGKRGAFIPVSYGGVGDFDPTKTGRSLNEIQAAGGFIPVEQTKPSHNGQYGFNLRYKQPGADTEFAAYYIRYHDKLPFVGFKLNPAVNNVFGGVTVVEQYGENKELFGFSANTKVGDWAFGTELSYRPRDSVAIDPTVPASGRYSVFSAPSNTVANGYVNEKKYQGHVTAFTWLPPELTRALGAADGAFLAEVAVAHYPGLRLNGEVPYLLNNYELPTKTSWGYVMEVSLTYANVFNSGWTATPIVDFYHDVKGTSPNTIPFVEGRKALAVGLNFDYHNQWKVGLGYSSFFGGGNLNLMRDRDIASMTVSYTF